MQDASDRQHGLRLSFQWVRVVLASGQGEGHDVARFFGWSNALPMHKRDQ
jgi:hypothetical protein